MSLCFGKGFPPTSDTNHRPPGTWEELFRTDSESVETTVRRRRMFAGFVARMGEERVPRRVMFGEMLGGKGYSGEQEWDWMKELEEDVKANLRRTSRRRVARGRTEGRRMVPTGRRLGGGFHAEMTQG